MRRAGQDAAKSAAVKETQGSMKPDFSRLVLSLVCRIPPGRVATYGDVAAMAGRPRAARAVGNVMRECKDCGVPCHRVVGAGGALGGYGGNLQLKRSLLLAEGIIVVGRRIRSFATARWRAPGRNLLKSVRVYGVRP
jgi:O-6-methylguanine DNA methyltransferase